ncbi:ECF transporter S component [Allofustis seminis]|uniref:ECF transporter S component n=1 Tax=Allofustis seminis TaxID=166939 RepID=UPI00035F541A|nr:ECF transporter S component [Allofustis seminis]
MKKISTKQLAATGLLGAITIFLGMTPLGFIPIGPTRATIMHIPVIIGSIFYGPVVGGTIGLIFGLFSLFQNILNPTPVSFVFLSPLVSIMPRILVGILTYYIFQGAKCMGNTLTRGISAVIGVGAVVYLANGIYQNAQVTAYFPLVMNVLLLLALAGLGYLMFKKFAAFPFEVMLASVLGSLLNTVGVLGMVSLLYAERFVEQLGQDPTVARQVILSIGILNGIPESIAAMVLVTIIFNALSKRLNH